MVAGAGASGVSGLCDPLAESLPVSILIACVYSGAMQPSCLGDVVVVVVVGVGVLYQHQAGLHAMNYAPSLWGSGRVVRMCTIGCIAMQYCECWVGM